MESDWCKTLSSEQLWGLCVQPPLWAKHCLLSSYEGYDVYNHLYDQTWQVESKCCMLEMRIQKIGVIVLECRREIWQVCPLVLLRVRKSKACPKETQPKKWALHICNGWNMLQIKMTEMLWSSLINIPLTNQQLTEKRNAKVLHKRITLKWLYNTWLHSASNMILILNVMLTSVVSCTELCLGILF